MYKNFFFLDNNAIITMIAYLNGQHSNTLNENISLLRRLDKKEHLISGLVTSIEGLSGEQETVFKKAYTIQNISDALKNFYKKANTDSKSLSIISESENISGLGSHEYSFAKSLLFRNEIYDLIHERPKIENLESIYNEVTDIAKKHNIQKKSIIYIVSISALYGKEQSRNVLKLNKEKDKLSAYNSVSDIYFIQRMATIKNILSPATNSKINFVTFDKSLRYLYVKLKCTNTHNKQIKIYGSIRSFYDIDVPQILFPSMSDERFKEFCNDIGINKH